MQGQYNHGDAYYRCRFPQEYALADQVPHPRNVYLREDALTDPLDTWLASAPHRIAHTITAMADAQPLNQPPTTSTAAQAIITECDAKLERYRAALDAGADPAVVTVLRNADPADKAEVYRQLGLRLNYQPETQTVRAEVDLSAHRGVIVCVRGATRPIAPPPMTLTATLRLAQA
ncbi:hypothetical protein [Micromonospora sp. LA-10]|uniref:hypothetical protein n=1 Tax=Micromonospora sp. LA-10 TaxID=3446364 RepID=UPI003F7205BF